MLGFYVPPTAKVIRRRDLGLKSHPKDWRSPGSNSGPLVYKAGSLTALPRRLPPIRSNLALPKCIYGGGKELLWVAFVTVWMICNFHVCIWSEDLLWLLKWYNLFIKCSYRINCFYMDNNWFYAIIVSRKQWTGTGAIRYQIPLSKPKLEILKIMLKIDKIQGEQMANQVGNYFPKGGHSTTQTELKVKWTNIRWKIIETLTPKAGKFWNLTCKEEIAVALNEFCKRWCQREKVECNALNSWKVCIFNIFEKRISFYFNNLDHLPPKPKISFRPS